MDVALCGNSPSTVTAGIMLLTRARQLGYPLRVSIVGEELDLTPVPGPAILYAPVLASCGVGREHGQGATVIVPGPPGEPVMVTASPHGVGGWFLADRTGHGVHPATQAYVRLSTDARPEARALGRQLRRVLEALGVSPDPAVLDVLFGAPAPPLLRIALALRAGRAMLGGRGESVTRFLSGSPVAVQDPIDPDAVGPQAVLRMARDGELRWILDRFSTTVHDGIEQWMGQAVALSEDDGHRDVALFSALVELASHLAQLPVHSILPPLGAAEDSVAVGLQHALKADGEGDANRQLCQVYRFLGGRFVDASDHTYDVSSTPAPEGADPVVLWQWFCSESRVGRKRADALFEQIFHPTE